MAQDPGSTGHHWAPQGTMHHWAGGTTRLWASLPDTTRYWASLLGTGHRAPPGTMHHQHPCQTPATGPQATPGHTGHYWAPGIPIRHHQACLSDNQLASIDQNFLAISLHNKICTLFKHNVMSYIVLTLFNYGNFLSAFFL